MVYITDWNDYQRAVLDLYSGAPQQTRFVTKYRHCDGALVLKVTDDRTCLKYRTDQAQDLKRWERLTRALARVMANRPEEEEQEEPGR
ncbi:signal recognition particle 9 kDa protein-like protein [Thamnocephalis sphaerospora]|uniref:Signal recognition particle 9 kDa protein n=1 Tax=Thamnocephalis sphaerospora TaxID=78915 RepID=A0A4P9XPC2_9FUNG|nr:signal recognition particle 9 kDa protein-like protein [Thamnocephalis sphaerospora]|eukprot:RKP07828.1 signal recognition particle 9 kDa protein-like protein [Thamnocephalis sphaerospora]